MVFGRGQKFVSSPDQMQTGVHGRDVPAILIPGLKVGPTMLTLHPLAKILHPDSKPTTARGTFLIEVGGPNHDGISFHRGRTNLD